MCACMIPREGWLTLTTAKQKKIKISHLEQIETFGVLIVLSHLESLSIPYLMLTLITSNSSLYCK